MLTLCALNLLRVRESASPGSLMAVRVRTSCVRNGRNHRYDVATNAQQKMSFDIQVALQVGTVKKRNFSSFRTPQCGGGPRQSHLYRERKTITVTAVQLSIRFRMPHDGVRAATSFFNEPQWPQ